MYEGKNIHYSSTDNKLLCSFSGKLCNQRRLNGYGFCVRHILEDQSAPFKRCAYVAKSSNQMCTQAIPKHEERRYCNNHMQVLGMLPKKERKKKEKSVCGTSPDNRLQLANIGMIKTKFSLSSSKESVTSVLKSSMPDSDPDDPYAFPDSGPSENKLGGIGGLLASQSDSVLGKSLQSGTGFVRSANDIRSSTSLGVPGGSMIAKYYPELAEKLEKMRSKPEPKASPKSRAKSSRTMNKLQTKIAQNKITEKLRKSQEQNHTDSNSSPLQLSSPEAGHPIDHSPSPGPSYSPAAPSSLAFSPQTPVGQFPSSGLSFGVVEPALVNQEMPPLPQIDTSLLATLAAQENMGFQTASETSANISSHLLTPHTPPRLPPPYPGSSMLSPASSAASSDLPTASPQVHLNSVIGQVPTVHKSIIPREGGFVPGSSSSSLTSLPFTPPLPHQPSILSPSSTPKISTSTPAHSFSSPLLADATDHHQSESEAPRENKTLNNHISALTTPPSDMDLFSILNRKQLVVDTAPVSQPSRTLTSPNTLAAQLSLPPPPPYVSPVVPHKLNSVASLNSQVPSMSRPKNVNRTHSLSVASVPHTKLRKVKGLLSEKAALKKLKSESAVKYYSFYAKRKISNHSFVGPDLFSSDDESEDEDVDMLPWQPDIFSASSDDNDEDENDECATDVPMEMRPTKLSLLKTRLRRQWRQARSASKTNDAVRHNNNQATLALIRTARESGACAVRALWQVMHVKKSKKKLKKRHRPKKRTCCHKNSTDGQCTSPCLPYTNHCLKHIMYNINQQIFDYCTAKFADNTQCCMPVFDIRHELPLCPIHAAKADNYQKQLEAENKKKPRKKSKPPALTRPPRKGKKKKKGRYARQQINLPPAEPVALDSTLSDVDVMGLDPPSQPEEEEPSTSSGEKAPPAPAAAPAEPVVIVSVPTTRPQDKAKSGPSKQLDIEMAETLSPDFDKPFELPLEQASRLLEESDLQEVVNKMHFDSLDLFGKTADADQEDAVDQTNPESGAGGSKVRDALETLLCRAMSEEESMQLAMILAQNLQTDGELGPQTTLAVGENQSLSLNVPPVATLASNVGAGVMETSAINAISPGQMGPMGLQFIGQAQGPPNASAVATGSATVAVDMAHSLASLPPQQQLQSGLANQQQSVAASGQTLHQQQQQQFAQLSQTRPQMTQQLRMQQQQRRQQHQQQQQQHIPPNMQILSQHRADSTQLQQTLQPSLQTIRQTVQTLQQSVQAQQHPLLQSQQLNRGHATPVSISINAPRTMSSSTFVEQQFAANKLAKGFQRLQPTCDASGVLSGGAPAQKSSSLHPQTASVTAAAASSLSSHLGAGSGIHTQMPDLNLVYGQLERLAQSQFAASVKKNAAAGSVGGTSNQPPQNLSRLNANIAKTVIRHLPTDSQPLQALPGSNQVPQFGNISSLPPPPPAYPTGDVGTNSASLRGQANLNASLSKSAPTASISVFPRQDTPSIRPQISLTSSTPSISSLSATSLSLSLPPFAKRAKLTNAPSVIQTQQQQQQQILQIKQQLQLSSQQIRPSKHKNAMPSSGSLNLGQRNAKNASASVKLNLSDSNMGSAAGGPGSTRQPNMPAMRDGATSALSLTLSDTKLSLSRTQGRVSSAGSSSEFLGMKLQSQATSSKSNPAKLRLPSQNVVISEIAGNSRLTLTDNVGNISSPFSSFSSSPGLSVIQQGPSSSSSSSSPSRSYETLSTKSSNSIQYTLTPSTSLSSSSPIQSTILSDPLSSDPSAKDASSESIFVLVRHPSPPESVPTTVRHTLPDTFPAQVTLPSSPLGLLPQASSSPSPSSSAPSPSSQQQQQHLPNSLSDNMKTLSQSAEGSGSTHLHHHASPTTSERHSVLSSQLSSPRANWFSSQTHLNGLPMPFSNKSHSGSSGVGSAAKTEHLGAKLNNSPAVMAAGHARSKTLGMPESRLSTLTSPVVCGPTTLPGFGQPIPTTAFKTSGTS